MSSRLLMLATLLAAATLTSASLSLSSLRNGGRTSDLQLCIDESLVKVWGAVSHKYYSHAMGRRARRYLDVSEPRAMQRTCSCCATLYRTRHDLS